MGSAKRAKNERHNPTKKGGKAKRESAVKNKDNKISRRAVRTRGSTDAEVAHKDFVREKSRLAYREGREDLRALALNKLVVDPRKVNVTLNGEVIGTVKGYSIITLAKALGKSTIQMRLWINRGYIPEPILIVVNHNYRVYTTREAQIIRKHLFRHTKTGISYLTKNSIYFIDELSTEIAEYRKAKYDN